MLTKKEMRQAIIDKYDAIPEKEVYVGGYIYNVGTKYVTILDTWERTTLHKYSIEKFYNDKVRGNYEKSSRC